MTIKQLGNFLFFTVIIVGIVVMMAKPNMGAWKPRPGDTYTVIQNHA